MLHALATAGALVLLIFMLACIPSQAQPSAKPAPTPGVTVLKPTHPEATLDMLHAMAKVNDISQKETAYRNTPEFQSVLKKMQQFEQEKQAAAQEGMKAQDNAKKLEGWGKDVFFNTQTMEWERVEGVRTAAEAQKLNEKAK